MMKEYPGEGEKQREKYFNNKWSSARIAIENAFGKLETRLRFLHCAMDIDIKTLLQVIISCFILHKYCQIQNKRVPEQNLL